MKKIILLTLIIITLSCTTVSDNVITSIDETQYENLDQISSLLEGYRVYNNRDYLLEAENLLSEIDLNDIYNMDYKAKILGLNALSSLFNDNINRAKSLVKELKGLSSDEELYWIVSSLLDSKNSLKILQKGSDSVYSKRYIDIYLAEAMLLEEMYKESAALFDTVLLNESEYLDYYQNQRDVAYMFMKNPPSNFNSGKIYIKKKITSKDLIDALLIDTTLLNSINQDSIYSDIINRGYFFNSDIDINSSMIRKDMAYFLFNIYADNREDLDLWADYHEYYIENPGEDIKEELREMTPVPDVPVYDYYFLPSLFLVEEEIMELPDGENFYPDETIPGNVLHLTIIKLKNRLE